MSNQDFTPNVIVLDDQVLSDITWDITDSNTAWPWDANDLIFKPLSLPLDNYTFTSQGVEVLKITPEGFYVRGQLVPQDEKEAMAVYKAFRQWQTQEIIFSR